MVTFYRRLPAFALQTPGTIEEALSLASRYKGKSRIIAGGTDVVPGLKRREVEAPECIIDLKGIPGLDYIRYDDSSGLAIGSLVTLKAIETAPVVSEKYGVLAQAVRSMASPQVRNRGTLAGNICNGAPSADSVPALLALEANLKVAGPQGSRVVAIPDFFTGPGQTVLGDEEILVEIQVPPPPANSRGVYHKLTPRRAMDLALVGVAVVIVPDDGVCRDIRIALGAVAPTPIRAYQAEAILRGKNITDQRIEEAAEAAAAAANPIDDLRASAEYRRDMVKVLMRRAIRQVIALSS